MHRSIAPRTPLRLTSRSAASLAALALATTLASAAIGRTPRRRMRPAASEAAEASAGDPNTAATGGEAASPGPVLDCVARDNARPICKFQSPEDIVPLPGNEALLISAYGAMGASGEMRTPGGLVLFSLADETPTTIYSGGSDADQAEAGWGDPTCPAPPKDKFNAHGIDLVKRSDGRLALLVVQHFGREAVEFFEVTGAGTAWTVAWKGCVLAPPDASLNEVVGSSERRLLHDQDGVPRRRDGLHGRRFRRSRPDMLSSGAPPGATRRSRVPTA